MTDGTRPGVMLYFDAVRPALNRMDDAQAGALFRALIAYAETGALSELDPMTALAFDLLRPAIDRDGERYESTLEQRKYAVYCRECKKRGEQPLNISEWRLLHLSVDDRPISTDIGSYPTTSSSPSTSPSPSSSPSSSTSSSPSTGEDDAPSDPDARRAYFLDLLGGYK